MLKQDQGTTKFFLFRSSPGKGPSAQAGRERAHRPVPQRDSAERLGLFPPHVTLAHLHPHGAAPREGNQKQTQRLLEHNIRDEGNAIHAIPNTFLPSQKSPPGPFGQHHAPEEAVRFARHKQRDAGKHHACTEQRAGRRCAASQEGVSSRGAAASAQPSTQTRAHSVDTNA